MSILSKKLDPVAQHIFSHALRQDILPYNRFQKSYKIKRSSSPALRKEANFAQNAKKWGK